MRKISQIWFEVQEVLSPFTEKLKHLQTTLELIKIEKISLFFKEC